VIGDAHDVAIMGAINVSPESFYAGSVAAGRDALLTRAEAMVRAGAAMLDVGAMSTAPYLVTVISPAEEADRLGEAVATLAGLGVPVSADTSRAEPARAALDAGARAINDVRGLTGDAALAPLVAARAAALVLMASERPRAPERGVSAPSPADAASGEPGPTGAPEPVDAVLAYLCESLGLAHGAGIDPERIAVDPGIGFFRGAGRAWHEWDCRVLAGLPRLRALGQPLCVGLSRKSFIGAVAGVPDANDRLPGSLAAAAIAVLGGAHVIRTHDVVETRQAVRVAEAVRRAADGPP
jgi:dihydropteroate synthase